MLINESPTRESRDFEKVWNVSRPRVPQSITKRTSERCLRNNRRLIEYGRTLAEQQACRLFKAFRETMCTRADRAIPSKLHLTVECKLHDAIYKLLHLNRTATPIPVHRRCEIKLIRTFGQRSVANCQIWSLNTGCHFILSFLGRESRLYKSLCRSFWGIMESSGNLLLLVIGSWYDTVMERRSKAKEGTTWLLTVSYYD